MRLRPIYADPRGSTLPHGRRAGPRTRSSTSDAADGLASAQAGGKHAPVGRSKYRSPGAAAIYHGLRGMPPRLEAPLGSEVPVAGEGSARAETAELTRRQRDAKRARWVASIMTDIKDQARYSRPHSPVFCRAP